MSKRKRSGDGLPPSKKPTVIQHVAAPIVAAPVHISAIQKHRLAYQHRMRQEEQAALRALHAEQEMNDLVMRIQGNTIHSNKRQHASHAPVQSKRRKTQDPIETTLNNIQRLVESANTNHRSSHHLKFLIHTVRQSRLSEAQQYRLEQLLAAIRAKGWRMPNVQDYNVLKF